MEVLAAYREVGTYRGAAAIYGTTHKAVKRILDRQRPAEHTYQGHPLLPGGRGHVRENRADPEQWRFDWEQSYTRQEWLDLLPTTGGLTRLPTDKLAEVLQAVGAAIDAIGGSFTMSYSTVAVTARREPPPPDPT